MPSPQEHEAELTRMRHTVRAFRVAAMAAAVGIVVGAGAVIALVGTVYSVIDRPATQAAKVETQKNVQAQKTAPQAQDNTSSDRSSDTKSSDNMSPAVTGAAAPRRIEQPPAPSQANRETACKDQTWPYIDGKCLTPADDSASSGARDAASAAPTAPRTPPSAVGSVVTTVPAESAGSPAAAQTAVAQPETTGAAPPAQPQTASVTRPAPQPEPVSAAPQSRPSADAATTGSAPADTPVFSDRKPAKKKYVRTRVEERKLARQAPDGAAQHVSNRTDRDSAKRDAESDDRGADAAMPSPGTRVILLPQQQIDVSSQGIESPAAMTYRHRKSARSRPEPELPADDVSTVRRDPPSEGGHDFFGALFGFGGQRD